MRKDWIEKVDAFLEGIKKEDALAIIYHPDADGVCAAAIFAKLIVKRRSRFIAFNQGDEIEITSKTVSRVAGEGCTHVLILDMNVDSNPEKYSMLEEKVKHALIIDHHIMKKNLESSKTTHLNISMVDKKPESYPTSKIVYDLLSELDSGIKKYSWLAAVGIVGDSAQRRWDSFLEEIYLQHRITMDEIRKAVLTIELNRALGYDKIDACLNDLIVSDSLKEFLESESYERIGTLESEFDNTLEQIFETRDEQGDVVFLELNTEYNIKSLVANYVSTEYFPDKTVVVMWPEENWLHISLRRQDGKISMDELIRKAIKELGEGKGGGHVPAAGGKVPLSKKDEFKKVLKQLNSELLNK